VYFQYSQLGLVELFGWSIRSDELWVGYTIYHEVKRLLDWSRRIPSSDVVEKREGDRMIMSMGSF
jgi:hypothetical protein